MKKKGHARKSEVPRNHVNIKLLYMYTLYPLLGYASRRVVKIKCLHLAKSEGFIITEQASLKR